jgi:hypothetical protein
VVVFYPFGHPTPYAYEATESKLKLRSPEDFLGVNSALVNLDSLVSLKKPESKDSNPFALTPSGVGLQPLAAQVNPFMTTTKGPPMNQMKNNNFSDLDNRCSLPAGGGASSSPIMR